MIRRAISGSVVLSCLLLLAQLSVVSQAAYGDIVFNHKHTQSIRRKDFYEITAGPKAYFLLFYIDQDQLCRQFAPDWNLLAADFADNEDLVFLQINCEFDIRVCRQQGVEGYPFMKVYHNGELHVRYKGVFFIELVREFIQSVSRDLFQETVE